jgi:hypothetical protein
VPDQRGHRGADQHDPSDFAPEALPRLRAGVADFSWLLQHQYAEPSALKVVGDRYSLTARQRVAVRRSACADDALERRRAHQVRLCELKGLPVWLDGFNVLMTLEAAPRPARGRPARTSTTVYNRCQCFQGAAGPPENEKTPCFPGFSSLFFLKSQLLCQLS